MNLQRRIVATLCTLVLVASLTACGPSLLTSFRLGFAASKPFVQSLVQSGSITQAKADVVTRDIDDGLTAAQRGETCVKAITSVDSAKRVAQAKCYFAVAQDLRVILERHNFGDNSKLNQISLIVAGAIEAFEQYYAAVTPPTAGLRKVDGEAADKQLKATLEDLNRQFKALQ